MPSGPKQEERQSSASGKDHSGDLMTKAIIKRTQLAGKSYEFLDDHDPSLPTDHWFQNAEEGFTFFLVFYTQACRWSRCLGCNLPSTQSEHYVPFNKIMDQTDYVFDKLLTPEQKQDLGKVILSNNGSVLDQKTFATLALNYFVARMKYECPNVSVLTLETRPKYVETFELKTLSENLRVGKIKTQLEIAVGMEAFDEKIRNEHFLKGLDLDVFQQLAANVAKHHFMLKVYFMQKPVPGMSEEEGIDDVKAGIRYLDEMATKYGLDMNMHLNPTYAAKGTPLAEAFAKDEFDPPQLESVRQAVLEAEGRNLSIFVGLDDEDLAISGGSFIRPGDEQLMQAMERFNVTQDFNLLRTFGH